MAVRREGVRDEIRRRRAEVKAYRARFPSVQRFLEDHYPEEWERVRDCRSYYRRWQSARDPEKWKVTPYACWRVPYCVVCTRAANNQHAREALDRFARVTPEGQESAFVHVVVTAPLAKDGWGWGWAASRDVGTFAQVVRRALGDVYGDGLGGIMSYQDFGERAFAKRHPHMDLTLNGWLITKDAWRPLPRIRLENGGYRRLAEATALRAQALEIGASESNVKFRPRIVGAEAYFRVLRYQLRELVDFRKVDYNRTRQTVEWLSYKNARRERFTVADFKAGYFEYLDRLDGVELHRAFGHMSKGRPLRDTERLVGGSTRPHGSSCPCSECGDWERRYENDLDPPEESALWEAAA